MKPTPVECERLLIYDEWEFGVILYIYTQLNMSVCVKCKRHRQREKLTNKAAECSSSVQDGLLNIGKRHRLQSCGRGDERLKSLTSCTSC